MRKTKRQEPMEVDKSPVRQRILTAAAELFCKHGFQAVGIDTIIEKAGVAKMSLYKHFPSKDVLICEFLKHRHEYWMNWFMGETRARSPDPKGQLLGLFDVLEDWFESDNFRGCTFINAAAELSDPDHPGRTIARDHHLRLLTFLREMADKAGFPNSDGLATSIGLLINGAIVAALVQGGGQPAREARNIAAGLLAQHSRG